MKKEKDEDEGLFASADNPQPLTDAQRKKMQKEAANVLGPGCLLSSLFLFTILPSSFAGNIVEKEKTHSLQNLSPQKRVSTSLVFPRIHP